MAIYDKVPDGGTFRAPLLADWAGSRDRIYAVALNSSGLIIPATSGTYHGLLVVRGIQQPYYPGQTPTYRSPKAGEIVDVMKRGEIVEVTTTDVAGAAAGQPVLVITADGTLNVTGTGTRIGHFVEATRVVVNCTL